MPSAHDMKIRSGASPEIVALAEVLEIAAPGLKMSHTTLAATMVRMLKKRGVELVKVVEPPPQTNASDLVDVGDGYKMHRSVIERIDREFDEAFDTPKSK